MPKEITFNQIVHLNAVLEEKDLPYHIDYVDGQVAGIEGYSSCACSGKENLVKDEITQFFKKEGMNVNFSSDGYTFTTTKGTI